jgi:hypothetical protein
VIQRRSNWRSVAQQFQELIDRQPGSCDLSSQQTAFNIPATVNRDTQITGFAFFFQDDVTSLSPSFVPTGPFKRFDDL